MKNLLIPLLFFLISNPIAAQIELHVGKDHTVNLNDPVVIRLLDHVGDVQWQRSFNSYEWQDIQDAQADSLSIIADITSYFRAKVTAGHCDPFYSDTTLITVAGETPGQGVIGPDGGVISYDDESSPIHGAFIYIPAGALEEPTHIEIIEDTGVEDFLEDSLAVFVKFKPEGLVFQAPVSIGLPFNEAYSGNDVAIFHLDEENESITHLAVKHVNHDDHIVVGETTHFSTFYSGRARLYWNINLVNYYNNNIAARVNIFHHTTDGIIRIPTLSPWWVLGYYNMQQILEERSIVFSIFSVSLRRARPWPLNTHIETKYFNVLKTFSNGSYGLAIYDSHDLSNLIYEQSGMAFNTWYERYFQGFPLIFKFDHEINDSYEYYARVEWNMAYTPQSQTGSRYCFVHKVNSAEDAKKFSEMYLYTNDENFNLIDDIYDETIVPGGPPTIKLNAITNIRNNSVSVSSEVVDEGSTPVTSRGLCISRNPGPTIFDDCTEDGSGLGSFTSQISLLSAQTNYYIRSYATNSSGTAYSTQHAFKTLPAGIAYVNTFNVSDITHNSASAIGSVVNQGSAPVTAKGFVWSTSEGPTLQSNLDYSVEGYGTGGFSTEITDLLPGTTYYVKAYATNSIATAYGEQVSFKTLAPPTVTTNAITGVGPTSATGGGNVTDDGGAPVTARGIAYSTSPNPTIDNNTVSAGSGTGPFSAQMTGLSPSTTYYVRAYATNIAGTSYGAQQTFSTSGAPASGYISGSVRDAVTSGGIANVNVWAYQGSSLISSTHTSSNGNYSMQLPVANNYRILFTKSGYIPAEYHNVNVTPNTTTYLEPVMQIDENFSGPGNIAGLTVNALNGQPLPSTTLVVREGINVFSGAVVATTQSSSNGTYQFNNLEAGNYTIEASKSGFVTAYKTVTCIGGQTTQNQNVSLTPDLSDDEVRIVLTWGADPPDLDAHLTGPIPGSSSRFHIYFLNMNFYFDGQLYANLDVDDINSYGPETVTIYVQTAGTYRYSVHDYTNKDSTESYALSNSSATVRVYRESNLLNTFNVPTNTGGTLWTVFELNGTTITPINNMSYESNPGSVTKENTDVELIKNLPEKTPAND